MLKRAKSECPHCKKEMDMETLEQHMATCSSYSDDTVILECRLHPTCPLYFIEESKQGWCDTHLKSSKVQKAAEYGC